MISPCAVHVPVPNLPAHVAVIRNGQELSAPTAPRPGSTPGLYLQAGDEIRASRRAWFRFNYAGNRYGVRHGRLRLRCRRDLLLDPGVPPERATALVVSLESGRIRVRSGPLARRAVIASPEMLAMATASRTDYVVARNPDAKLTRAWSLNRPFVAAKPTDPGLRITTRVTYTAISDARGLRLDVWPFSISSMQRSTTLGDSLPAYWADGLPCSVGCTAPGTIPGWPLQPFHRQHAIRAGINELRPANFHVGVDIEAADFQPVYAIQSGYARIRYPGTGDVNVDVGSFYYWHVNPTVAPGQYVVAYRTMIGRVLHGFGHLALSEGTTSDYLNPLRPGGSLRPYTDTEPPVIGIPRVFADGRVIVAAFDPQSFVERRRYETPALAPSSLAWRLSDAGGRPLTGLEWAMRGSQNFPPGLKPVLFAPGASNPGFVCFFTRVRCIPNWTYRLAGGLTPPLPLRSLPPGRYRLTVYAWDWAGNTSALDYPLRIPLGPAAAASNAETGPLAPKFDYP
jgi:hypothetical protein